MTLHKRHSNIEDAFLDYRSLGGVKPNKWTSRTYNNRNEFVCLKLQICFCFVTSGICCITFLAAILCYFFTVTKNNVIAKAIVTYHVTHILLSDSAILVIYILSLLILKTYVLLYIWSICIPHHFFSHCVCFMLQE